LFKADPARHTLGQNVMEEYGITRWEPPAPKEGNGWGAEGAELQAGMTAPEPPIVGTMVPIPKYDVENFKKYSRLLEDGEQVFYTVKIHGANARYVFTGGEMHCGSRTTWKLKPGTRREFTNPRTGELIERFAPESSWWKALEDNPWIEEWCRKHPGQIVYGEIFGPKVQGNLFNYGKKENQIGFRVFDVLLNGNWVDFETLTSSPEYAELQLVPIVFSGPHNREVLEELAEAPETSLPNIPANHIREGIVIKPFKEKYDERLGRVALKYVSNNYLTKS
jgi:RNA ligase (TIGR02306 family)